MALRLFPKIASPLPRHLSPRWLNAITPDDPSAAGLFIRGAISDQTSIPASPFNDLNDSNSVFQNLLAKMTRG
jgi:hypothetical protein